ncbi:equilibrative nucleoside transporter 1-like isoform X1 [Amphibalanus amphitrite]|uniref:equilibrative nucleoside transporter 1-like isoform X1 n=2 Tax=Amphibalanus amphitrite TaxID=1232801 RepID=UPI001C9147F8|nr:equilibrative nucleoside transporter 1-like isoform X1 [Amphibalanus amphitrite]
MRTKYDLDASREGDRSQLSSESHPFVDPASAPRPLVYTPRDEPVKLSPAWEASNVPPEQLNFLDVTAEKLPDDEPPHDSAMVSGVSCAGGGGADGEAAPLASTEDLSGSALGTPRTLVRQQPPSRPPGPAARGRDVSKRIYDQMRLGEVEQLELQEEPTDSCSLIYLVFVLHGIGTLMPWNMFITAKDYFVNYKLSEAHTGVVSEYATNFLPYVGFASHIPSVLINWINVFARMGGSLARRIIWSLCVITMVFIFTVILAMVDSSRWPGPFFFTTITSVVILNVANGIYQNSVYGLAARLPFRYTGAVVLGSNISGTVTALIKILSIAMAPNPRTAAIYYFITALFILLACFDTYFALPLSRFYRYHKLKSLRAGSEAHGPSTAVPYWHIFKKAFPQLLNVFLVFFVTLSVFPTVLADINMVDEDFFVPKQYFAAVLCFFTFNFTAMLGNLMPNLFVMPTPRWLWLPVVLRFAFIPYFVLCNYLPVHVERVTPVYINNDWAYWGMVVLLGLSSGYFSSLGMMYCPRTVEPQFASTAGMFGAAALVTGVCSGVQFSLVLSWFVQNVNFA